MSDRKIDKGQFKMVYLNQDRHLIVGDCFPQAENSGCPGMGGSGALWLGSGSTPRGLALYTL